MKKRLLYLYSFAGILVYGFMCKQHTSNTYFNSNCNWMLFNVAFLVVLGLGLLRIGKNRFIYIPKQFHILYTIIISTLSIAIIEIIWYQPKDFPRIELFVLNVLIIDAIIYGLVLLSCNHILVYILTLVLSWLFSIICHYVYVFKDVPISPGDIQAFRTGLGVAGSYEYEITDYMILGTVLLVIAVLIISFFPPQRFELTKKNRVRNAIASVIYYLCIVIVYNNVAITDITGIEVAGWARTESIEQLGVVASFTEEMQQLYQKKPTGYSASAAQDIIDDSINSKADNNSPVQNVNPNVIVIMNESFSDLSVLGDFESEDYLSFFNSVDDYVQKGYVYSSVYGAGTCNSEYEFLTGSSMAFASGYPFMSYDLSDAHNIAEVFKSLGYEDVALHPNSGSAWNRDSVFRSLQFDRFITRDDMAEYTVFKSQISDESDYEYIKREIESVSSPIFMFNITIQNHGGYDSSMIEEGVEPIKLGDAYEEYVEAQTFLTGMKESDRALECLFEYLGYIDEPTVLCIYGDHQPALGDGFQNMLLEQDGTIETNERYYMTPYMIWANYDLGSSGIVRDMSINYLGANLLSVLGINDEYFDYLSVLEEELPVINSQGYKTSDGVWHTLDESNDLIDKYRIVQYYGLFDYKR